MPFPDEGMLKESDVVDVVSADEKWNTYLLSDGTVLKMKTILIKVKKNMFQKDEEGNPLYYTKTQLVVDVNCKSPNKSNNTN